MNSSSKQPQPEIQLFCNLVIRDDDARVLLVRPQRDDERWWLPWADLEPYEHPDDAVAAALKAMSGLRVRRVAMAQVQSFRGRGGWHVTFDYLVQASGNPASEQNPKWFPEGDLPRTVHGEWEKRVIRDVSGKAPAAQGVGR